MTPDNSLPKIAGSLADATAIASEAREDFNHAADVAGDPSVSDESTDDVTAVDTTPHLEQAEPTPLTDVMRAGVTYRLRDHDQWTLAQFDRAAGVVLAIAPVLTALLTAGKAVGTLRASGNSTNIELAGIDFDMLIGKAVHALKQNPTALYDVVAIAYVADDVEFDIDYDFALHRKRLSGASGRTFSEGIGVFFGYFKELLGGGSRTSLTTAIAPAMS